MSVGELANLLPMNRPAISQHPAVLRRAGLARVQPERARRYCELHPEGMVKIRSDFELSRDEAVLTFEIKEGATMQKAMNLGLAPEVGE